MKPIPLFHEDGKTAGIFYCSQCRIVARTREAAEQCCAPAKCSACGAEAKQYYTKCEACLSADRIKREADRFEKAEKVESWDGPVYCDSIGWNEGYFRDLGELEDWIADQYEEDGIAIPPYAWACNSIPFCQVDIDRIIENATQEAFEDWDGETEGYAELKAAIEKFNEANKALVSWKPNYKLAVVLLPTDSQSAGVPTSDKENQES
jgi:hypothetical protein